MQAIPGEFKTCVILISIEMLEGGRGPHYKFVVIASMIMKFGTGINLDVFYTMETKNCEFTTIT